MNDNNIRFQKAEEALRYLVAVKELEGSVGSVSGRAAADGELGLTPDGDAFGPDVSDRINARNDIEEAISMDMDWRYRKVLDLFLSADCIRMYPEREDGTRRDGAHAMVQDWAGCTPCHANRLIDNMLTRVDRNLWRMSYLYADPDGVHDPELRPVQSDDVEMDMDTALSMSSKWVSCPYEYAQYYSREELEEMGHQSDD
ncbi:MAG: hypothetical protein JEY79_13820 [Pseudodesulfovibrio sp.]|nr:hypothetical protein [Pseudodesulfovibrio sp.]